MAEPPLPFRAGDRLVHAFNPDLGPGKVEEASGRRVTVLFPRDGTRLTFSSTDTALRPLVLGPGLAVRVEATGKESRIVERIPGAPGGSPSWRLAGGEVVPDEELWPMELPADPVERLAALQIDRGAAFRNRLDGVLLARTRTARGLGSFLGGRIALVPHQLHVAERATAADPVRWLLADEVGLGKTVEACLILSRLLRTNRADRAAVVAPSTLTIQWLGELYRKFHQTFVLLDAKRREDVAKEHGEEFNPFEAHRHMVVPLEDLEADPALAARAAAAGLDLLVVDEAHRLERGRGDQGNAAYRAIAPLAAAARHLLLLSATPLEADAHGFFRLLELVRPDAYRSEEDFLSALAEGRSLPPCTSATRRVDIGGLPPRVSLPVELPVLPESDGLSGDRRDLDDPRVEWLVARAAAFARGGAEEGKSLVFCHERDTLAALKEALESATRRRVAVFHEELTPERRDLEVAEFRRPDGPLFLIATECGGEGRNFEFCRRLVLFDLPDDPASVEQRIGRLDRISRKSPVEIVYFRPPSGFGARLVELYEEIGLFREPLGGLEHSLASVEAAIAKARRLDRLGKGKLDVEGLAREVREAATARASGIYHHLHAGGYQPGMAEGILSRVPGHLDEAMERFVLEACHLYGFDTADRPGKSTWYVEFGGEAILEHLPGVPGGSRFLGTFSRDEAVVREELDFFASGHALVEGIFQELEDGSRGRAGIVKLPKAGEEAAGVLVVHGAAASPKASFVDLAGNDRPDLCDKVLRHRGNLRGMKPEEWFASLPGRAGEPRNWPKLLRSLVGRIPRPSPVLQAGAVRLLR